jgi:putative transcriptional regulator
MDGVTTIDVRKLRLELKMTQNEFSNKFGFEISTLRHWEQGQRSPTGPARTLLTVISKKPDAVIEALQMAQAPAIIL